MFFFKFLVVQKAVLKKPSFVFLLCCCLQRPFFFSEAKKPSYLVINHHHDYHRVNWRKASTYNKVLVDLKDRTYGNFETKTELVFTFYVSDAKV